MAHFYGTVKGRQGEASRLGDKDSGLRVVAASHQGSIEVHLANNRTDGQDTFSINMRHHGQSEGWEGVIARGTMGVKPAALEQPGILPTPTIESFSDEELVAEVKRRFNFELLLRQPNPPKGAPS